MLGQSWGPLNNCQVTVGQSCSLERGERISVQLHLQVLLGRLTSGELAPRVLSALSQGCHEK